MVCWGVEGMDEVLRLCLADGSFGYIPTWRRRQSKRTWVWFRLVGMHQIGYLHELQSLVLLVMGSLLKQIYH